MKVLNQGYAASGISFNLLGTDRTTNKSWFADGDEAGMKRALRKGDYKTLNVYFMGLSGGLLGYCYFPDVNNAQNLLYDGCSILFSSVPGGSTATYNLGLTATHEIGHWFGIYTPHISNYLIW